MPVIGHAAHEVHQSIVIKIALGPCFQGAEMFSLGGATVNMGYQNVSND